MSNTQYSRKHQLRLDDTELLLLGRLLMHAISLESFRAQLPGNNPARLIELRNLLDRLPSAERTPESQVGKK